MGWYWCGFELVLLNVPVIALRVLGVMVWDVLVFALVLFMRARKAAVLGEAGGKETGSHPS